MSPKNLVRATEHNPATDIQSIRELLRGYGSTVSLLKEMVQNAIDAEAENVGVMKTEKQFLRVLQDKEVFNLLNKIAAKTSIRRSATEIYEERSSSIRPHLPGVNFPSTRTHVTVQGT